MEWIWCTACEIFAFELYGDFETLGFVDHSGSSKVALFDGAHTTLVSRPYASICYRYRFRDEAEYWSKNRYPLVFGAPVRGYAVRFTQHPWCRRTTVMGLSDRGRISTIRSAVLIQSTYRRTDRETDCLMELPWHIRARALLRVTRKFSKADKPAR